LQPDVTAARSIDVAVIGAGIVGVATAFKLAQAGRKVLVIDRKGVAEETSRGNAGAFAFSDVIPMATSGVLGKLPRWLSDPLGPLTIPPAYLPQITPWLLRFWRAGWPDRFAASLKAQAAMMRVARREMDALVADAELGHMIRSDGVLELYESEAELRSSARDDAAKAAEGIEFRHVRGAELAELQPGLSPRIVAATFIPKWQTVTDPYDFAVAIANAALQRGVEFLTANVAELSPRASGATIVFADRTRLEAAKVVGHGFVVTPLSIGVRVGGAVELGGLTLPPNFARADAMLKKAAMFLPGLATTGGRQWMGFRPSLPDSLPAIGRSRASPDIVYAFGHGHLGLTQSAGTGKLVAQLVTGAPPSLDLTPFSPQRF
jgi:D-amino-acid dehydrogenase